MDYANRTGKQDELAASLTASEWRAISFSLSHELRVDCNCLGMESYYSQWFGGHPPGDPDIWWRLVLRNRPDLDDSRRCYLELQLATTAERTTMFVRNPRLFIEPGIQETFSPYKTHYIPKSVDARVIYNKGGSGGFVVIAPTANHMNLSVLGYVRTQQPIGVAWLPGEMIEKVQKAHKKENGSGCLIVKVTCSVEYHRLLEVTLK